MSEFTGLAWGSTAVKGKKKQNKTKRSAELERNPSVRPSVRPSVHPSIHPAATGFKFSLGPGKSFFAGSNKLLLSQWNIWDHALTSQEILTLSQKCNLGVGNVGSWAEMYDASNAGLFSKPSTCNVENSKPADALQTAPKSVRADRFFKKRPKKN